MIGVSKWLLLMKSLLKCTSIKGFLFLYRNRQSDGKKNSDNEYFLQLSLSFSFLDSYHGIRAKSDPTPDFLWFNI